MYTWSMGKKEIYKLSLKVKSEMKIQVDLEHDSSGPDLQITSFSVSISSPRQLQAYNV